MNKRSFLPVIAFAALVPFGLGSACSTAKSDEQPAAESAAKSGGKLTVVSTNELDVILVRSTRFR